MINQLSARSSAKASRASSAISNLPSFGHIVASQAVSWLRGKNPLSTDLTFPPVLPRTEESAGGFVDRSRPNPLPLPNAPSRPR